MTLPRAFVAALETRLQKDPNIPLGTRLGRIYMAPSYIKGSRRFYQNEFADFMSICRAFGQPDLFITITVDPNCIEITEMMGSGQKSMNRCDLVVMVFEQKIRQLFHLLLNRKIFGAVAGYCGTYEHQNRGNVHFHLLVILQHETNNIFQRTD